MNTNPNEEKYNVICFSNQLWDFPAWTNKRHVMGRLAAQGHNVLFVDPPINLGFVLVRQLMRGLWDFYRILTQTKKDASLTVYSPINLIPITKISAKLHIMKINSLAKKLKDSNKKTILWIYHVQVMHLEEYVSQIPHDILVYDCVDNYTAFPDKQSFIRAVTSKEGTVQQEEFLATKADVVFASAPGLVEKLKEYRNEVYFTPNVGDYAKFNVVPDLRKNLPEDIKEIKRPRIGFVGALDDYKFDKVLFAHIVKSHPNYSYVLIGPMALKDKEGSLAELGLDGYKNVTLLGTRDYTIIQNYFAGFDVFIIPYVLNDYTVGGCFPVKFHDGLAAGLPVVVTDLPAYLPFKDVSYISKTFEEFSNNIEKALKEDSPEKIKARQQVAKENNWDGKVDKMLSLIKATQKN